VLNLCKEVFPGIQPKSPPVQLEAISSHPVTCHQGEETNPALTAITFQVFEESNKVSPQPFLPQTKQPQFLQSFLIGHILQPCCPSLDLCEAELSRGANKQRLALMSDLGWDERNNGRLIQVGKEGV